MHTKSFILSAILVAICAAFALIMAGTVGAPESFLEAVHGVIPLAIFDPAQ